MPDVVNYVVKVASLYVPWEFAARVHPLKDASCLASPDRAEKDFDIKSWRTTESDSPGLV